MRHVTAVEISPELLGKCRIPSDAFRRRRERWPVQAAGTKESWETRYLISFPSGVMDFPEEEGPEVARAAHAVVQEAKEAGVYLFSGGPDEDLEPVMVAGDGTVTGGTYPQTKKLNGGFTVVDVPTREAALEWAAKIAVACRCAQEIPRVPVRPARLIEEDSPALDKTCLGRLHTSQPAHRQIRVKEWCSARSR
jgi:hypothetical protein